MAFCIKYRYSIRFLIPACVCQASPPHLHQLPWPFANLRTDYSEQSCHGSISKPMAMACHSWSHMAVRGTLILTVVFEAAYGMGVDTGAQALKNITRKTQDVFLIGNRITGMPVYRVCVQVSIILLTCTCLWYTVRVHCC